MCIYIYIVCIKHIYIYIYIYYIRINTVIYTYIYIYNIRINTVISPENTLSFLLFLKLPGTPQAPVGRRCLGLCGPDSGTWSWLPLQWAPQGLGFRALGFRV